MSNKWAEFASSPSYRLVDLGRPAVFLIPVRKLKMDALPQPDTVEEELRKFLLANFGAYTVTYVPSFGCWRDGERIIYDECVQYEVSFAGKEHIPLLLGKLARVALITGEKCIYVKSGQYSALVYPLDK